MSEEEPLRLREPRRAGSLAAHRELRAGLWQGWHSPPREAWVHPSTTGTGWAPGEMPAGEAFPEGGLRHLQVTVRVF